MQCMEIKHEILFLLVAITKHICITNKEDKYFSPLSNENMHITQILKYFSPFLSIINKGVKVKSNQTNFSPPLCQKQRDQEG